MKKTLLLFAMLLGVLGAWAQEDNFVTPEAGKYYIIKGLSTTAPYLGKSNTNSAFSVVASESDAGIFYVEASNNAGKYYMTCVNATSATQFFGYNGDVRLMDQKQNVTLEAATDGKYYIAVDNNWMHNNKENSIGTGSKDATTQNQWGFIEAPLNTAPEITLTNVQPNGDRLTLYVDDTNALTFSASSPTELGAKAKFAYTVINEKYVFFNKSKNCYLIWRGNTSGGFNGNKGTLSYYNDTYCKWTLATDTKDGVSCFRLGGTRNDNTYGSLILLTAKGTKNYRFDAFGNSDGYTLDKNGSQYSNWFTVQVNCSLYNEESECEFKWMYETSTFATDPKPTITGIVGATLSDEFFNGGSEYSAKITFPFPVSSETKINPTMISSFSGDINKWYATEAGTLENGVAKKVSVIGTKKNQEPTDANRMTYMWAIYPTLKNNAFTYKVKNLATGTYVHSTSSTNSHAPGAVTLQSEGSELTYVIDNNRKQFKLSTNKYLSLNSTTVDYVQYVGTWGSHGGCGLSLTQVEDVNFELHSFAVKSVVEGYESSNPNTHLGAISVINGIYGNPWNLSTSTISNVEKKDLYVDLTKNISLAHTRNYRGYKFLGFWLGETELGQTPTLTAEQVNAISETNPIIAKYEVIPGEVTLFYDDDAFSYRIPAIAKTSTGRLIAVSDYRHNLDDIGRDNHGTGTKRIDLVARTSDDNGQTWSETMTIAAGDNSKSGTYQRAFGDAAIVAVGQNIVVMAAAGDQVYNGATTASPNRMARIFSSDNGETWSITEITSKMYNSETSLLPNGVAAFFGSGKLVVDANFNGTGLARIYGALLVRINNSGQYDNYNNYVVYSDDLGENWKILGGSTNAIAKGDEPKVEILPSGQILLSARRGGGRKFNVFTYGSGADDKANGVGTWSGAADGCGNGGSNGTNGEIMCIDAKKPDGTTVSLLLQSQPKGGSDQYDRKDVTIWYKEITNQAYNTTQIKDGWTEGLQVSTQKSAYSAMAEQADGKIAFFFEEAPCYGDDHTKGYSMVYMPLTLEKITGGKYTDKNAQAKTVTVTVTDTLDNTYNESLNIFVSDVETIKNLVKSTWAFADFGDDPIVVTDGTSITYTNTVTLPFKVSNNENTYWHNIYFPSNGNGATEKYPVYMSSDETTTLKISTEKLHYGYSSLNTKANADKISWAIYQKGNGFAFKFKNKLKDQYIKTEGDAVAGKAQNVKYTENAEEATAFDIVDGRTNSYVGEFGISTNGGQLIVFGVGDGYVSYSTAIAHQGAWVKFVEAPDFDWHIEAVNRELRAIGTAVGLYATDDDVEAARTAMTSANTVKWNTLKGYYENIRRDGREVNTPSVGMYRIKNKNTGAYIHGNANGTISLASKFDNYTSIFYLNENNQLISYRMGRHLDGQAKNLAEVNTACDVEFNVAYSGVTEGVLTIKSNGAWIGYLLYQPTIESSTEGTQSAAYDWTFEKVEWLPVPVNTSVGYATLYSPVALNTFAPKTQNHRVEAYIGTIKGDRFSMEQVDAEDGIIPAKTPVILVYKQDAENGLVYLQVVNSDKEAPENELSGTFESSYIEDDAYVLSKPADSEIGLYKADKNFYENNGTWTKDTDNGTHFLNNGFKAYLPVTNGADARFFVFDFGGNETGIESVEGENGNANSEVYDLSGRRVQNAQKGIFIVNGKKVIK